jgi:hypothetical protein
VIALCRYRSGEYMRAPHSLNRQRFALLTARRGAPSVMLDKAGGDMVPLRLNLWPPKESEVAGISIHWLF